MAPANQLQIDDEEELISMEVDEVVEPANQLQSDDDELISMEVDGIVEQPALARSARALLNVHIEQMEAAIEFAERTLPNGLTSGWVELQELVKRNELFNVRAMMGGICRQVYDVNVHSAYCDNVLVGVLWSKRHTVKRLTASSEGGREQTTIMRIVVHPDFRFSRNRGARVAAALFDSVVQCAMHTELKQTFTIQDAACVTSHGKLWRKLFDMALADWRIGKGYMC